MTVLYGEGKRARERLIIELARAFGPPWTMGDELERQYIPCTSGIQGDSVSTQGAINCLGISSSTQRLNLDAGVFDTALVKQQYDDAEFTSSATASQIAVGGAYSSMEAVAFHDENSGGELLGPFQLFNELHTSCEANLRPLRPQGSQAPYISKLERKHNCGSCRMRFSRVSDLQRHHRVKHCTKAQPFACRKCAFTSKRKDKVMAHCGRMHANQNAKDLVTTVTRYDPWLDQWNSGALSPLSDSSGSVQLKDFLMSPNYDIDFDVNSVLPSTETVDIHSMGLDVTFLGANLFDTNPTR